MIVVENEILMSQGSIMNNLKKAINRVEGCEDVLLMMLQFCATRVDNGHYALANEKHAMLRVMPYCLILLDLDGKDIKAILKKRKLALDQYIKIFKVYFRSFII